VTKFTHQDLLTFLQSICGAMDILINNGFTHGDHGAGENTFFEHTSFGTRFILADFQLARQHCTRRELTAALPAEKENFNKMLMLYVFTQGYCGGGSVKAMDTAYGPELRILLQDFGYYNKNKNTEYTFVSLANELSNYPF
jgi:hypothetical protein